MELESDVDTDADTGNEVGGVAAKASAGGTPVAGKEFSAVISMHVIRSAKHDSDSSYLSPSVNLAG